jgi:hypothetical protein
VPVMYSFFGTSARKRVDDESDWQEIEAESAEHALV